MPFFSLSRTKVNLFVINAKLSKAYFKYFLNFYKDLDSTGKSISLILFFDPDIK